MSKCLPKVQKGMLYTKPNEAKLNRANSIYSPLPSNQYKALTPKNPKIAMAILPATLNMPMAFPLSKVE